MLIDIIVIVFLLACAAHGWRTGFISIVGNFLSLIFGFIITTQIFAWISASPNIVGEWVKNWHLSNPIVSMIAFVVVFWLVVKALKMLVRLLNSLWSMIGFIPFVEKINNLFGLIIGSVSGVVVLLALIYVLQNFIFGIVWKVTNDISTWGGKIITSKTYVYGNTALEKAQTIVPNLSIWK